MARSLCTRFESTCFDHLVRSVSAFRRSGADIADVPNSFVHCLPLSNRGRRVRHIFVSRRVSTTLTALICSDGTGGQTHNCTNESRIASCARQDIDLCVTIFALRGENRDDAIKLRSDLRKKLYVRASPLDLATHLAASRHHPRTVCRLSVSHQNGLRYLLPSLTTRPSDSHRVHARETVATPTPVAWAISRTVFSPVAS